MLLRALAVAFTVFLSVPADALASELTVERALGGKVELSLPAGLAPADEETKRTWHPTDLAPPAALFVDDSRHVSIAVNVHQLRSMTIDSFLSASVRGIRRDKLMTLHDRGKRSINGRKFGFVEFTWQASEVGIYNYQYFTFDGDQFILFLVNCTTDKLPEWKPLLDEVVASTRFVAPT